MFYLVATAAVVGIGYVAFKSGNLKQILIGSLVLICFGLIDPSNVGMILVFGIICTAGLGLIPILIVAWIIGSVVMFILNAMGGHTASNTPG